MIEGHLLDPYVFSVTKARTAAPIVFSLLFLLASLDMKDFLVRDVSGLHA